MDAGEQRGRLGRLFAALVGTDDAEGAATPTRRRRDDAAASHLGLEELSGELATSADPAHVLRRFVTDVRRRAAAAEDAEGPDAPGAAEPSALETYLAERLQEAGVLEEDGVCLPAVRVVRPTTTGLFYLRVEEPEISWAAKVKVLRTEAALNAALLATLGLEDAQAASLEDLVRFEGRCARSVLAQAPLLAERREAPARGEWAVRAALSEGIERMRLPQRLTARFRVNESAGLAAFEFEVVPPRAWWATAQVDGLGLVSATTEMRRRAASEYNLRVGLLLAAYALLVAPFVDEVWVAGVEDTAAGHACYLSARLTRPLLEEIDLRGHVDPWVVMRAAGASVSERDLTLGPVRQGFSLDDERLCPARRFDPVELSDAGLAPGLAQELGCERMRDLGIDEAAARRVAANGLARQLGKSTEQNVRALLATAEGAPQDVRESALRCVRELIEGTLEDDPYAILEAFVSGGTLEREVARAREAFLERRLDDAERIARQALEGVAEKYADTEGSGDEGRVLSFSTYADRVLYNRFVADGPSPRKWCVGYCGASSAACQRKHKKSPPAVRQ